MATRVAAADELTLAYRRLTAAYEQSLRYADDVRELYRRLRRSVGQSLLGLANALEAKDPYTRGHSERVGRWSRRIALGVGLPPEAVQTIAQAGLLHDIGKIGVPESILGKAGPLEEEEWALMRRHPVIGSEIVAPFECLAGEALVIRHHHERHDGSGYPDGLAGEAIPLGARIVAVADVFDALTSDRPYRAAMSRAAALEHLMSAAGTSLDADVVAVAVGIFRDVDA
jgi:HD-GYP domain-containing protein (c-di-GMP phosphodiesterase class II)